MQQRHLCQRLPVEAEEIVLLQIERQSEGAQQVGRDTVDRFEIGQQSLAPAGQVLRPFVRLLDTVAGENVRIVRRQFALILERLHYIRGYGVGIEPGSRE